MRIITLSLIFLLLTACAQTDSTKKRFARDKTDSVARILAEPLPISPHIIKGKLDNGLQYIIRENKTPANFAELRLIVHAGSLQEDESQLGFAHFAEHMAFNGTEDFEKQEIIEYIEAIGMRFGPHLNAFTSFDDTRYQLRLPTDQAGTLEKGFHILENWAHKISFEADSIDQERGVVLEEWRSRKGARERILSQGMPVKMHGTLYAERMPIGSENIILNGKHEDLVRFYTTWYRPELMSIIAVGDFDGQAVEGLIQQYFGKLVNPTTPVDKPQQVLTAYTSPEFIIITDPEITQSSMSIDYRLPATESLTGADLRESTLSQLAENMLNKRFQELAWKQDAPFTYASVQLRLNYTLGRNLSANFGPKPGRHQEAFSQVLSTLQSMAELGPYQEELDKQKHIFIDNLGSALAQQSTINHQFYVGQYLNHFVAGNALFSLEQALGLVNLYIDTISIDDIKNRVAQWIEQDNAVISLTAPASMAEEIPEQSQLANTWAQNKSQAAIAYIPQQEVLSLMQNPPVAGAVLEKAFDESWQAHIWTLSNGVKVVLKPNDYQENTMQLWARSPGGYSLVDDATYQRTHGMMSSIDSFGLGELDIEQLNNFMQGKRFNVSTQINTYSEDVFGESDQDSIEEFFQSLHLQFVGARKDQARFDWIKDLYRPQIEQRMNNPNYQFSLAIQNAVNTGNPRQGEFDLERLDLQNLDDIYALRMRSFSNAADFQFVIVGDIDLVKMEDMLSTYVASLPASPARDRMVALPEYQQDDWVEVDLAIGSEPKATVVINYTGDGTWSHKNDLVFDALIASLDNRLRTRLREELAGVYSVRVNGSLRRWPHQNYAVQVSFSCDPDRIDELRAEVEKVFDAFIAGDIPEQGIINFKTQLQLNREKRLKENGFWTRYIMNSMTPLAPLQLDEFSPTLNSVSLEDVKLAAKHYLKKGRGYFASLRPK